jgi:hypothetical protein
MAASILVLRCASGKSRFLLEHYVENGILGKLCFALAHIEVLSGRTETLTQIKAVVSDLCNK